VNVKKRVWELTHKGRLSLMERGLGYWGEKGNKQG